MHIYHSAAGNEDVRIISVDLQEMAPIENTFQIQGDITKQETVDEILHNFKGNKAELVICDGAPDGNYKIFIVIPYI